jgi:hypothetical protein
MCYVLEDLGHVTSAGDDPGDTPQPGEQIDVVGFESDRERSG